MKKLYTLLSLLSISLSFGQAFTGTYDFASVTSISGLTDPSPVPTATGVTFGSFSAVISSSVVTPPAGSTGALRFSFLNQSTGATNAVDPFSSLTGSLDPNIYYQVTLTPQAGKALTLTQITFKSQRSSTGIRTFAVRSSADNYATNLSATATSTSVSIQPANIFFVLSDAATTVAQISTGNTVNLTNSNLVNPITFRFYGWNAEAAGGSFSIDDVVFTGSTASADPLATSQNQIAGLSINPNPVSKGVFYVNTTANETKNVVIVDLLGKQVLNTITSGNEINVSNLNAGVYIVKVTEEGKTATRKLVIQ